MNTRLSAPALREGLLARMVAGLFGLSTRLVQRFGQGLGALTTAALRRSDLPRLLAMAGFGAVLGSVALTAPVCSGHDPGITGHVGPEYSPRLL